LCDLLNNTNLFPEYKDHRLKDNIGPIQRGMAFNEWLRIFSNYQDLCKNPPACCKAIYHQYLEVMAGIPFNERRKPDQFYSKINKNSEEFVKDKCKLNSIQSLFIGMKYVVLKRDIFEQTISTYIARQTQKYHIYTKDDLDRYLNVQVNKDKSKILEVYEEMLSLQSSWNNLICRNTEFIEVNCSDVFSAPETVLSVILDFTKTKFENKDITNAIESTKSKMRTYSMRRPEASGMIKELKSIILKGHSTQEKLFL
jgi:LPS sulfotransferase NodH